MEEKAALKPDCSDFEKDKHKEKLEARVQEAVDKINKTLEKIGLEDCRVDKITFSNTGMRTEDEPCEMVCDLKGGKLTCWCAETVGHGKGE